MNIIYGYYLGVIVNIIGLLYSMFTQKYLLAGVWVVTIVWAILAIYNKLESIKRDEELISIYNKVAEFINEVV